jgi:hypothetical protein
MRLVGAWESFAKRFREAGGPPGDPDSSRWEAAWCSSATSLRYAAFLQVDSFLVFWLDRPRTGASTRWGSMPVPSAGLEREDA